MNTVSIYTLSCPLTGRVKYVGASKNVEKRIKAHLWEKKKILCSVWLQELHEQGLKPVIHIVDQGEDNWQTLEQYWIAQFRAWGFTLLNRTDGGIGMIGFKQSEFSRKKESLSKKGMIGKKPTPERRAELIKQLTATGLRGSENFNSKYTEQQVALIKRMLLDGGKSKVEIARIVGVKDDLVYDISRNKIWKHINPS